MPIRQLAPDVAAKIAAGEVVERPASVVKELIENSIDAGATQIRVDLVHGGLQLIRVSDNGSGIPADELELALARHATSKVAVIDDLEHIRSLGFRGEALSSIAAVADVTLLSRVKDAEQGAQISAMNGQLSPVTPAASPQGTTLTVRNLFSAVPARLKFLKSRNTEIGHCHHLLEQYALAYPEIRFSVFSESRQIFSTPGNGQLSSVLIEVYGLQVAEQMVAISNSRPDDAEYPVVSGYVSRPTCYKSTRQYISFFVNRRWVLSRMLTTAVEGAYKTLLLSGRHPVAVINIQLDPTLLDVNVHPAKTEIRFLKERRVFAAILQAVRAALLEEPEMPSWQSGSDPIYGVVGGGDVADSSQVSSTTTRAQPSNDDEDPLAELDEGTESEVVATRWDASEDQANTPILPQDNPWLTYSEEETGTKPPVSSRLWQSHLHVPQPAPTASNEQQKVDIVEAPLMAPARFTVSPLGISSGDEPGDVSEAKEELTSPTPASQPAQTIALEKTSPARIEGLWAGEEAVADVAGHRLPRLRVIGQLSQSYIVTEGDAGLYLIDQHAAHERILLERMVASLKARDSISQLLLTPLSLVLAPTELEAIEDHLARLQQIGFSLQVVDSKTLEVLAVPGVLTKRMNAHSLHELLIELTSADNLGHTENWEERALANVACKAAIKQNYFLTVSEMREMIEQLEQTNAPYSCCHGRPTMVQFSLSTLEREFGRR